MAFKYSQHDGYDKYRSTDSDDRTTHSGKASYDEDGSLERLDIISPSSKGEDWHHHEWMYKNADGSYHYDHGEHKNH